MPSSTQIPDQESSTIRSSPSNSDVFGSRHSRNSLKNFKSAATAVKLGVKACQGFTTLRDMASGADPIRPADLTPVRKLGEGAFAVVEEALYRPYPSPVPTPCCGTPSSTSPPSASGTDEAGGAPPQGAQAQAQQQQAPQQQRQQERQRGSFCGGGGGEGRRVAVKRLKGELVDQAGDLDSFVREAALMRKLAHRSIVQFMGVGSSDTSSEEAKRRTLFLVQEFMDGGTLKRLVSRQMIDVSRQLYSYPDALRWALQIAEGLEYLHCARPLVIHRDLKLENILLKSRHNDPRVVDAKIADFGLVALVRPRPRTLREGTADADAAKPASPTAAAASGTRRTFSRMISTRKKTPTIQELWDQSYRLSLSSRWRGSPPPQQLSGRTGSYMYMAPEMYRQEEYNEKVDVFSYGVILFELLSRYQMVCAVSVEGTEAEIEAYAARVAKGYRPPLPPVWPPGVRELVALCWDQEPSLRPSMSWVRERLVAMIGEGVGEEMQATLRPPAACGCVIS